MHWPPDPQMRSPAAANGRANRNSKASASLGNLSYTNSSKFSTPFGRSSSFPNDALGREAQRAFERWVVTLSPKQRKRLYGAQR
jgi:hypothetical protein